MPEEEPKFIGEEITTPKGFDFTSFTDKFRGDVERYSLYYSEKYRKLLQDRIDGVTVLKYKDPVIDITDDSIEINVGPRQYEIGTFNNTNQKRFIATYGADPCHILTVYDSKSKTGLVAHIDHLSTGFGVFFDRIIGDFPNRQDLSIRLLGGNQLPDSISVREEILEKFRSGNINFSNEANNGKTRNIALDLKTGMLYEAVAHFERQHTDEDFEKCIIGPLKRIGSEG